MSLLGSPLIPRHGLDWVSRHAQTLKVAIAKIALGLRHSLEGSLAIPLCGLRHIPWEAVPLLAAKAEVELRLRGSAVRCLAVQIGRAHVWTPVTATSRMASS